MAKQRKKTDESQQDFLPGFAIHNLSNSNRFWKSSLFNDVYLLNTLPSHEDIDWKTDLESGPFYDFYTGFLDLCHKIKTDDPKTWNEQQVTTYWIIPIMELLGWGDNRHAAEQVTFSQEEKSGRRTYRPDVLYVSSPAELSMIKNGRTGDLGEARRLVKMVVEAKIWGELDRLYHFNAGRDVELKKEVKNDGTKGLTPEDQTISYQNLLKLDFGILTDGKTWVILNTELSEGSNKRSFIFNLEHTKEFLLTGHREEEVREQLKYFFYLFRKGAYVPEGKKPSLATEIIEISKKYATEVEEDLKANFLRAMSIVCNGLSRNITKDRDLNLIRSVAESHIFNILFIKSCEARGILSLRNTKYLTLSLSEMIDSLDKVYDPEHTDKALMNKYLSQRAFKNYDPKGNQLYSRLLKLYSVVQNGDFEFQIKGFRETVFSTVEWDFAKDNPLTNEEMVDLLFVLGYTKNSTGDRKYQQIPYSFFTPRQLGSIYESFLEYQLDYAKSDSVYSNGSWTEVKSIELPNIRMKYADCPKVKKGQLYFTKNDEDRKATGAYYTPDPIVRFIVNKTLLPLVEGKTSKEILKINLCDPAMGSGHFLNAGLEFLTLAYRQALANETIEGVEESFSESARKVLDSCIYGIDLNSRAVKLAKMGLWLATAFEGRELEKLDKQLVQCDSLLEKTPWKKAQSFVAILGNPPYISASALPEKYRDELRSNYKTCVGAFDIYVAFYELGVRMLADGGRLGYITSNKFCVSDYGKKVRDLVLKDNTTELLVDCTHLDKVFKDASVVPVILVLQKSPPDEDLKGIYDAPQTEDFIKDSSLLRVAPLSEVVSKKGAIELFKSKSDLKVLSVLGSYKTLSDVYGKDIRTGIMGFEYWQHEKFICEKSAAGINASWKLATPGLISSFKSDWGVKELRLYKKKFKKPVMLKSNRLLSKGTVDLFNAKKIVIRGVGRGIESFFDEDQHALLVAAHAICNPKHPYFLTALMNSLLVNWLYSTTLLAGKIPQGSLKYPIDFINSIPVNMDDIDEVEKKAKAILGKEEPDLDELNILILNHYKIPKSDWPDMLKTVNQTVELPYILSEKSKKKAA